MSYEDGIGWFASYSAQDSGSWTDRGCIEGNGDCSEAGL
jgi:hypothetical protein